MRHYETDQVTRKRRMSMAKHLVIIGGGAAGPSAAAEAKRGDPSMTVTIIEQGPFVSTAS